MQYHCPDEEKPAKTPSIMERYRQKAAEMLKEGARSKSTSRSMSSSSRSRSTSPTVEKKDAAPEQIQVTRKKKSVVQKTSSSSSSSSSSEDEAKSREVIGAVAKPGEGIVYNLSR